MSVSFAVRESEVVGAGTLFSYLSAFVTIVLALGLTDLLTSFHRLLRAARTIRWAALPLAAALFVLLSLLSEFFTIWQLTLVGRVSFLGLLVHLLPTFFIFLAASAVLPDSIDAQPFDLDGFYFDNRRYLYFTLAAAFAADGPRSALVEPSDLTGLLLGIVLPTVLMASLFVALAISRRRWLHWAVLAFVFALIGANFPAHTITAPAAVVDQAVASNAPPSPIASPRSS